MNVKKKRPITLFPFTTDDAPVGKRTRYKRRTIVGKFNGAVKCGIPVDQKILCGELLDFNKDVRECVGHVGEERRNGVLAYKAIYLCVIDNVKFRSDPTEFVRDGRISMQPYPLYDDAPPSPPSPSTEDGRGEPAYRCRAPYEQVINELAEYSRELNLFREENVTKYVSPREHRAGLFRQFGPHITIPYEDGHHFRKGDQVKVSVLPRVVFTHFPLSLRQWVIMAVRDSRITNTHMSISEYVH